MTCKMNMLTRIRHIFPDIQKFHRYFVYRMYHINDNDPDIRVLFLLTMVHMCHLLTLNFIVTEFLSFDYILTKTELILFLSFFFILHYILFYKPEKWKEYTKEFENETKEEKRKGAVLVWGYLIVSLILPIFLPVIYYSNIQ